MMQNFLYQLLDRSAEKFKNKTAISYQENHYSYQDLYRLSNQIAAALMQNNIVPNDCVAFCFKNSVEFIACYFSAFKIGAAAVPINARLTCSEMAYLIKDSQPKLFLYSSEFESTIMQLKQMISKEKIVMNTVFMTVEDLLQMNVRSSGFSDIAEEACAAIFYTSGSTAHPKGAIHTQKALMTNAIQHTKALNFSEHTQSLVCLSLSFSFISCHQMLSTLYAGGTLHVMDQFDPLQALTLLDTKAIDVIYAPPVVYQRMISAVEKNHLIIQSKLKTAVIAGDVAPRTLYEKFYRYFGVNFCSGIGMTETLFYTLNLSERYDKLGSLGTPVEGAAIKIVGDNNVSLKALEVGEIVINSPTVMKAYLNKPEETKSALVSGWLFSGDLGYLDEDNFLWFVGRKKHIIVRGGAKIAPPEIEDVLLKHPDVLEAAVVGTKDEVWGEVSVAFVKNKPDCHADGQKILSFLKFHLADYKIPAYIIFIDELPKGSTEKLNRLLLQKISEKVKNIYLENEVLNLRGLRDKV